MYSSSADVGGGSGILADWWSWRTSFRFSSFLAAKTRHACVWKVRPLSARRWWSGSKRKVVSQAPVFAWAMYRVQFLQKLWTRQGVETQVPSCQTKKHHRAAELQLFIQRLCFFQVNVIWETLKAMRYTWSLLPLVMNGTCPSSFWDWKGVNKNAISW